MDSDRQERLHSDMSKPAPVIVVIDGETIQLDYRLTEGAVTVWGCECSLEPVGDCVLTVKICREYTGKYDTILSLLKADADGVASYVLTGQAFGKSSPQQATDEAVMTMRVGLALIDRSKDEPE